LLEIWILLSKMVIRDRRTTGFHALGLLLTRLVKALCDVGM